MLIAGVQQYTVKRQFALDKYCIKFLALSLSDVVLIMLINVKMPTIVGILTFINKINFVLG